MLTRFICAGCIIGLALSVWAFGVGSGNGAEDYWHCRLESARELNQTELAVRFGGWCDEYCEVERFTCNENYGSSCPNSLAQGNACMRCESDTQEEECNGDEWCIPYVTCTDCIEDTPLRDGNTRHV